MRRLYLVLAVLALTALAVATAATAKNPSRDPGVRPAQASVCPVTEKPSEDKKGGRGNGGNQGNGNGNGNGNDADGEPNGNGNGNSGGNGNGNANGHGNGNANGQGNGNANGQNDDAAGGNGQGNQGNGQGNGGPAECLQPPAAPDPGEVAGGGMLPPAESGKTFNVEATEGTVRVKWPTGDFAPLTGSTQLREGAIVDARDGTLALTIAGADDQQQTANFTGAKFEVRQPEKAPVTELVLRGGELKDCARLDHDRRAELIDEGAIAAGRRGRSLFGSGKGRFRTRGRWGSATVRGTVWKVEDTCEGTRTTVVSGVVKVHDFGLDRFVRVRGGQQYFAQARP